MIVLIFDIDGVLIDDTHSYYEAIRETVSFYIKHFFQKHFDASCIDDNMIRAMKKIGNFNDDFDVTAAFVCYYISLLDDQLQKKKKWDFLSFLKKNSISGLPCFFKAVGEKNKTLLNFFKKKNSDLILSPDSDLVKIFQEIYLGEDLCKKIYGKDVRFVKCRGCIHNEESLVTVSCLKKLSMFCDAFAIATGREREEALYSLKKHFKGIFFEKIVSSSDLPEKKKKPHPETLWKIDDYFSEKSSQISYFFVGDQIDDMRMAFAAKKKIKLIPIAFFRKRGTFSREEFEKKGVQFVISEHFQIESFLKKKGTFLWIKKSMFG